MARTINDEDLPTTGHDWDGIREYDRPTPSWWLWVFWASVAFAVGYWVLMPAWPLVGGYTKGLLGYSQRQVLAREMATAREEQAKYVARIAQAPLETVRTDPELLEFALAAGRSAFAVNCSQCHGQGAQGAVGYPNLNDDDWLWGGTLEEIQRTIRFGARSGNSDAHESQMPAFLKDQLLDPKQVNDAAEFVLSLSKRSTDAAAATRGAALFAQNCASCHGDDGRGNKEVGAPNLADPIWLYGGDKATIVRTISYARRGVMPAWEGRLDPVTIKELAVYVHSLGGGK
jgi:cytochrome c oxidase cbb3-type subunit 3